MGIMVEDGMNNYIRDWALLPEIVPSGNDCVERVDQRVLIYYDF